MDTPEAEREFLLEQIREGRLKLLVFTHEHGDHFCLEDVLEADRAARQAVHDLLI